MLENPMMLIFAWDVKNISSVKIRKGIKLLRVANFSTPIFSKDFWIKKEGRMSVKSDNKNVSNIIVLSISSQLLLKITEQRDNANNIQNRRAKTSIDLNPFW